MLFGAGAQNVAWPPAPARHHMVYDPASSQVLLLGGAQPRRADGAGPDRMLWSWGGSVWQPHPSALPPRANEGGALPFRFVTKREFLNRQIEIVRSRSTPSAGLLAYYQRLLTDATDDVAFVKQAQVPGLTESGYAFTTLEDSANRIYVTVNPDYYDRSLSKSAPQHILIRLRHADVAFLNGTGNGARHLERFQKLREIVRANLPEFRSMVK